MGASTIFQQCQYVNNRENVNILKTKEGNQYQLLVSCLRR